MTFDLTLPPLTAANNTDQVGVHRVRFAVGLQAGAKRFGQQGEGLKIVCCMAHERV